MKNKRKWEKFLSPHFRNYMFFLSGLIPYLPLSPTRTYSYFRSSSIDLKTHGYKNSQRKCETHFLSTNSEAVPESLFVLTDKFKLVFAAATSSLATLT